MPYAVPKEEFRPEFDEIADRALESDGIKEAFMSYAMALEGPAKSPGSDRDWHEEARGTLCQTLNQIMSRAEQSLTEERYEVDAGEMDEHTVGGIGA